MSGTARLRGVWENLARTDPLWAIVTVDGTKDGGWDVEDFRATGRYCVDRVRAAASGLGHPLGDRVLDFGCGVGRLSNPLAALGHTVVGVDIAEGMVLRADAANQHPERLRFLTYDGYTLPFADGEFDAVVSLFVLQHMPPPVQLRCLVELLRVLKPGGVLGIQLPVRAVRVEPLPVDRCSARIEVRDIPAALTPNEVAVLEVTVTNAGAGAWPIGQEIKLADRWWHPVHGPTDDGRCRLPSAVAPSERVTLRLPVTAPDVPGDYVLDVDMTQECVRWFGDVGSAAVRRAVRVRAQHDVPASGAPVGGAEMHALPVELLRAIAEHCGARIVGSVPDWRASEEWDSHFYVVLR